MSHSSPKTSLQNLLYTFFSQYRCISATKGQILINGGDPPPGVFLLVEGAVRQYVFTPKGNELTLHIFQPYSFFPMMWAINQLPNEEHYEVLSKSVLYLAPQADFLEFFHSHPQIALDLNHRLLAGIKGLVTRIQINSFGNAYCQVVSILIYLAGKFGQSSTRSVTLSQTFPHQDIAKLTGLTRERVSTEMSKLKKSGLIRYRGRHIVIPSLPKLKSNLTVNLNY